MCLCCFFFPLWNIKPINANLKFFSWHYLYKHFTTCHSGFNLNLSQNLTIKLKGLFVIAWWWFRLTKLRMMLCFFFSCCVSTDPCLSFPLSPLSCLLILLHSQCKSKSNLSMTWKTAISVARLVLLVFLLWLDISLTTWHRWLLLAQWPQKLISPLFSWWSFGFWSKESMRSSQHACMTASALRPALSLPPSSFYIFSDFLCLFCRVIECFFLHIALSYFSLTSCFFTPPPRSPRTHTVITLPCVSEDRLVQLRLMPLYSSLKWAETNQ